MILIRGLLRICLGVVPVLLAFCTACSDDGRVSVVMPYGATTSPIIDRIPARLQEVEDMARKFMFVCMGLLALALAFQLGARSVSATAKPIPMGIIDSQEPLPAISHGRSLFVITDTGDCYYRNLYSGKEPTGWQYFGNINDAKK